MSGPNQLLTVTYSEVLSVLMQVYYIEKNNATACIPDKSNSVVIHDFDKELYKSRNIVERFFQRIKKFRHIATRYDKLAICFLNFVLLAAIMIQI